MSKRVRFGFLSRPSGTVDHMAMDPSLQIHLPPKRVSNASKNVSNLAYLGLITADLS